MATFGCPTKFIAMVWQFHDGMLERVQNHGEFSDPFPVTNGVKLVLFQILHYENTPIQIYRKFHLQKLKTFRLTILIFFIFLLKI